MALVYHSRAVLSSMQGVEQPAPGRAGDGDGSPLSRMGGRGSRTETFGLKQRQGYLPRTQGVWNKDREQGTRNKGTRANSK